MKVTMEITSPFQLLDTLNADAADTLKYLEYTEVCELIDYMDECFLDCSLSDVNSWIAYETDDVARVLGFNNFEEIMDRKRGTHNED